MDGAVGARGEEPAGRVAGRRAPEGQLHQENSAPRNGKLGLVGLDCSGTTTTTATNEVVQQNI